MGKSMTFPTINHIDQIRSAIEGRPELYIAEREFGYVANYMVQMPTTFIDEDPEKQALLRECRGLMFSPEGKVIARRFHKFFNIGEKTETFPENFPFDADRYYLMDKLDGSMITPIPMPDGIIRWATKMGLTDVAIPAEYFAAANPAYHKFAAEMIAHNLTPIFEWTSRKQRIVIDYPQDNLVLLAIRENVTGYYCGIEELNEISEFWNIPLVFSDPIRFAHTYDLTKWLEVVGEIENTEGYVIRFNDGRMLKVKTNWYKRLHKAKEGLVHEKNIVEMIVREQLDDLKDALQAEDLAQLEKFETAFIQGLLSVEVDIWDGIWKIKEMCSTKKDFALSMFNVPPYASIIFRMWDKPREELMPLLKQCILSHVSSQSKVDATRWVWGDAKWNYGSIDD
jgi:T4 RnlA family RNA ligase